MAVNYSEMLHAEIVAVVGVSSRTACTWVNRFVELDIDGRAEQDPHLPFYDQNTLILMGEGAQGLAERGELRRETHRYLDVSKGNVFDRNTAKCISGCKYTPYSNNTDAVAAAGGYIGCR